MADAPTDLSPTFSIDGYTCSVFRSDDAARKRCEEDLDRSGLALPLPHRLAWEKTRHASRSWFVAVRDAEGECCCGYAMDVASSRLIPGHHLLRVERFGVARDIGSLSAALKAVARLAREATRTLRVNVELYSLERAILEQCGDTLRDMGFTRVEHPRCYRETIIVDLSGDESEILASLSKTGRQNVRSVDKNPVTVRAITTYDYIERMESLLQETMARTGGVPPNYDWKAIVDLCRERPALSRLSGLFRDEKEGPEALLAFAWGRAHGPVVEYSVAASTRVEDLRLSLGYGPAWDLIRWAKRNDAGLFDFGGITRGDTDSDDPLGGISDFKRYFSKKVMTVGDEWALEPSPSKARIAGTLGATVNTLRGFKRSLVPRLSS